LNAFEQYSAPIKGIDLHFIHERGEVGDDPVPILLLHGWPSSVWEFHKIIHLLTDAGFSVVVPSLPGYGFSFRPFQDRFGLVECADALSELMTGVLGYEEHVIAGGDWGAHIGTRMAYAHPNAVVGLHLNMLPLRRDPGWPDDPSEEESAYLGELGEWLHEETGYSLLQGTRPQTPAYALSDSPVGLAAWIVEKFARWSESDGDPERRFSRDDLITTVMLYWATGAIGSSFWPYYSRHHGEWIVNDLIPEGRRIETPTCYIQFPREIVRPPTLAGGATLQSPALDGRGVWWVAISRRSRNRIFWWRASSVSSPNCGTSGMPK
jgi:pimeloyl-ACP methyl ester carboxylesterase